MPATGSGPARTAFERLMARYAAALRGGSALAAAAVAFVGLTPPASATVVGAAVAGLLAWTAGYAAAAVTRGWTRWLVPGDIAVSAGLCLGHGGLVPAEVLADGSSWVFVVASTTVIVSQLNPRPLLGAAATVLVVGAHVGGLLLAGYGGPSLFSAVLALQGGLVGSLMTILRRCGRAADAVIAAHERTARDAALRAAHRAEEREHRRLLHDSVSATLTVLAAGGVPRGSAALRAQVRRDLAVVARVQGPPTAGPDSGTTGSTGSAGSAGTTSSDGTTGSDGTAGSPGTAGSDGLAGWLDSAGAAAGPALTVDSFIVDTPVPARVGAAFAGAVGEALTNARRHAGVQQVRLHAGPVPDGVLVVLTDAGAGFDPDRVPPHRRGLRESVIGRMRAVGGSVAVTSRPGGGTRIELRWPAAAEPGADPAGAAAELGDAVATRYRHGLDLAVVWLVGLWYVLGELASMVPAANRYRSFTVEFVAWVLLGAVGVAGAARLLRRRDGPACSWLLAGAALAASAAATAMVPGSAVFSGADWAWDATGWIGVLLLLRRPLTELAVLVTVNAGFTLALLVAAGAADAHSLARFATVTYATSALQLAVPLAAWALGATARRAVAAADAEAAVRRRRQVAEALHASRRERHRAACRSATPLLAGLATGELDPADPSVRRRCAVEAGRLRRLFAETDDVPEPLLHELRACADIADRRGVLVDLQVVGRLPALDLPVRRALTEAPLHALAGVQRYARITVVGRADEVAIGVLADGPRLAPAGLTAPAERAVTVTVQEEGDLQWIEARWRRR